MPDAGAKLKRPQISAFGEGTVVKRSRSDTRTKPKSSDGRPADARAILSGAWNSNSGFRVKPVSSPAGAQKPQRPPKLPLDQSEALSAFNIETASKGKAPACVKPPFLGPRPPLSWPDSDHDAEPQKKFMPVRTRLNPVMAQGERQTINTASLMSRIRPPELQAPSPRLTTPARKVVPFQALPMPFPDESPADSSSSPLKPLPPLKFDLGGRGKAKLTTMTALELPTVELPEEKEVEGETLELRRGLLMSPEKGDRKRGRFIRGGLAERAQVFMNRSSTSLTLWKKEIESSASRPERLRPDLRLRVKDVLHISRNENVHSRSAGTLRSVLALCELPNGEACSVLFSFATDGNMSHVSGSKDTVAEGNEILVWKPWQEVVQSRTLFCSRFAVLSNST